MTLIEALEQRQLEMLGDGRSTIRAQIASETGHCIAVFQDACTPRPPKPEWFGTPFDAEGKATGKWDAWCCVYPNGTANLFRSGWEAGWQGGKGFPSGCRFVPVAREGFPAPVGWQVVEVKP